MKSLKRKLNITQDDSLFLFYNSKNRRYLLQLTLNDYYKLETEKLFDSICEHLLIDKASFSQKAVESAYLKFKETIKKIVLGDLLDLNTVHANKTHVNILISIKKGD